MEGSAYIGSAAAGLVYFVLGFLLVPLGIRTGSPAEKLLGLTFLIWALSFTLWVIAIALQGQPALESQLLIASRIANNLGGIGIAYFPLLAFRRGSTWAKWLSASSAICLVVGTVGSSWGGDPEGVEPLTNFWWWLEWIGTIAPSIWIGAEGFHHYGTFRPPVRLGFYEPIVCHRYLLWGIAGVFWALLDFVTISHYIEFWATGFWSVTWDIFIGFCEIAALAMIWLVYFAPAVYQRRINASAVSA